MRITEIIEGRFDPYQNKAIFFAGVPGAVDRSKGLNTENETI